LKVGADVQFDDADQLRDVPGADLIHDESRDFAFLRLRESLQHFHLADVEIGANARLTGEFAAEIGEKAAQLRFEDRVLASGIFLKETLDAFPEILGECPDLGPRQQFVFEGLRPLSVVRGGAEFLDEISREPIELMARECSGLFLVSLTNAETRVTKRRTR
jgi:hypothetical protein